MFSLQTIFGSGKQFYSLLNEAAHATHDSTKALYEMMRICETQPTLDAFKLARKRERAALNKIDNNLVNSFITPIEREDIQALASVLHKIPKLVEGFAHRYVLAIRHVRQIDFAPRAAMLERANAVVVDMVGQLEKMNLDHMSALNDKLHTLENEADRLILELYRDIYSGNVDNFHSFLLKEFFEILERAIDRCQEAGNVVYQIVLKNS